MTPPKKPASQRAVSAALIALMFAVLSLGFSGTAVGDTGALDDSGTGSTISAPPNLDEHDTSRSQLKGDPSKLPAVTPKVQLVSSWPSEGVSMWTMPREAHLIFDKAVRPVDVSLVFSERNTKKEAKILRAGTSPDLKTIIYSVDGVTQGDWVAAWTAGSSSGTFSFRMDASPSAQGGGNHREHAPGPSTSALAGTFTVAGLAVLVGLVLPFTTRRSRRRDLARLGTAAVVIASSAYMAYTSLDLTSPTELAKTLASATVWSWIVIAGCAAALSSLKDVKLNLAVATVAIGSLGTMPWVTPLAQRSALSLVIMLNVSIAAVVLALVFSVYNGANWPKSIKLLSVAALIIMSAGSVAVADGFNVPYGAFTTELLQRGIAGLALIAVTLLLTSTQKAVPTPETPESADEAVGGEITTGELTASRSLTTKLFVVFKSGLVLVAIAAVYVLAQLPPGKAGY